MPKESKGSWLSRSGVIQIGSIAGLLFGANVAGGIMAKDCPVDPARVYTNPNVIGNEPNMAKLMNDFCVTNNELSAFNPKRLVANLNLYWRMTERKFGYGHN